MHLIKKFSALLCSVLVILTSILPTSVYAAETQSEEPIPVESTSNVSLYVEGEGTATIQENGNIHTVTSTQPWIQDLPVATSLHIEAQAADGYQIQEVTKDGTKIPEFSGSPAFLSFESATTEQNTVYLVQFTEVPVDVQPIEEIVKESKSEPLSKKTATEEETVYDSLLINEETFNPHYVLTAHEQQVLNEYKLGQSYKDKYKEERKEIVQKIHAQKYVDSDFFITDVFFEDYSTLNLLTGLGATILVDPDFHYEENYTVYSDERSHSSPVVTHFEEGGHTVIAQGNNSVYGYGGIWHVDGNIAYCGQAMYAPPRAGQKLNPAQDVSGNERLRKAMYYSYLGQDDRVLSYFGGDRNQAILATNELVSYCYSGTSLHGDTNGQRYHFIAQSLLSFIFNLPSPPANFKIYAASNPNYGTNWQQQWTPCQTLVWGEMPKKGILNIRKVSANPEITDNNPCYDLKGAEYGVFKNHADAQNGQNRVATLVIGSSHWEDWAQDIELDAGTYYIKETKAPKGYALNSKIVEATVRAGERTDIGYNGEFSDEPLTDPIGVLLGKIDKETNMNKPQGSASLENAEFTIKYFKGYYDSDPTKQDVNPVRTWVFKTNSKGIVSLSEQYKISGDKLFMLNGVATLPLGTITIQETKAPSGYYINNTVFVQKITQDFNTHNVILYNAPKIPEQAVKLHLKKIQEGTGTLIPGAVFKHTAPDGTIEELTTNAQGMLSITGLTNGRHTLEEIRVPDGYDINPTTIVFDVASGGKITMITDLWNTGISTEIDGNKDTIITVEDKVSRYSLKLNKINDHGIHLNGAEFTLYSDKECKHRIDMQTTSNGTLQFFNLENRTDYYFKETKAPAGYRIPLDPATGKPHVYHLYVESTPVEHKFDFYIDGVKYTIGDNNVNSPIHLEGTVANRIVSVQVVNAVGVKLPETGGKGAWIFLGAGLIVMATAYAFSKRNKKTEKEKHDEKNE